MSAPKEYVLVTGAAGFIAFHSIEALLRRGQAVIGIDNFDPFYERSLKDANIRDLNAIAKETGTPFRFIEQDICELSPRFSWDAKITQILHLAAKAGVRPSLEQPEAYLRANVQGTLKILEFCRDRGIQSMVFGSSSSVYGDSTPVPFSEDAHADLPISPYAATKRSAEHFCATYAHLYGISVISLRFFTVYGPRQRPDLAIHKFAKLIASGKPITLFGDGNTERDYTFVSDIVKGIEGALKRNRAAELGTYEVYNLGGSATTPLRKLVNLLESDLGIPAQIEWAPAQPGDVQRTYADISKARNHLGYAPQVPAAQGIAKFVDWFKSANPGRFSRKKAA